MMKNDPQYERSRAYDLLASTTDASRKLKVHKLHIPRPAADNQEESEGVNAIKAPCPAMKGIARQLPT